MVRRRSITALVRTALLTSVLWLSGCLSYSTVGLPGEKDLIEDKRLDGVWRSGAPDDSESIWIFINRDLVSVLYVDREDEDPDIDHYAASCKFRTHRGRSFFSCTSSTLTHLPKGTDIFLRPTYLVGEYKVDANLLSVRFIGSFSKIGSEDFRGNFSEGKFDILYHGAEHGEPETRILQDLSTISEAAWSSWIECERAW